MTDKSTVYRLNALLTEHFGFPPLSLIDDVINAVNDIMYKCTKAMEEYLCNRQESGEPFTKEEINEGIATFESLLESQVDKNFDKFELYALRNIFTLPPDLIQQGYIKLKHHEGVDFVENSGESKQQLDDKISRLMKDISSELHMRKILKLQIAKANKIIKVCQLYQSSLKVFDGNFLANEDDDVPQLSPQAKSALKSLSPLDETLYFILSQVHDLNEQTNKILKKINPNKLDDGAVFKFKPDLRTRYIDTRSINILQKLGVVSEPDMSDTSTIVPEDALPSTEEVELVKNIAQEIRSLHSSEQKEKEDVIMED